MPFVLVVLVMLVVRAAAVVRLARAAGPLVVQVELGKAGRHGAGQRGQAAGALAGQRRGRRSGDENAFGHGLEPDVELDAGADGDAGQLEAQVFGGRDGQLARPRGARLTAERAHVEDKRAMGCVSACVGHGSVLVNSYAEPSA